MGNVWRNVMSRRPGSKTVVLCLIGLLAPAAVRAQEPVKVFAASSLMEAFGEIAADFEKAVGTPVELSFAGSQVLRTQIEQGAPADVYAFADLIHADALKNAGLVRNRDVFTRNALAIVVPGEGARIRSVQDVARRGMKVVVAGPAVPVGHYTAQVIAKLAASGLYGDDFQTRVLANVVSQETNVRTVLAKVTLGEADAGFVYLTDAKTVADKVGILEIADRYNVVAEYPIGLVAKSKHPLASSFVERVVSPDGQRVLRKYGFR
jgi:molybdate transport system substrate-binding protein